MVLKSDLGAFQPHSTGCQNLFCQTLSAISDCLGEMRRLQYPPIWKLNLTTPAIRHNVWQLQQIGQTIAKVFHFCPLFVSLNTSLSGNLHTFSSPFQRYPTCLISVRACCWSTVLWTARRTWRRRPGRSLTLGCINSVGIFFNEDVIQP